MVFETISYDVLKRAVFLSSYTCTIPRRKRAIADSEIAIFFLLKNQYLVFKTPVVIAVVTGFPLRDDGSVEGFGADRDILTNLV